MVGVAVRWCADFAGRWIAGRGGGVDVEASGLATRGRAQQGAVPGDRSMQWRALGPVEAVVAGRVVDLGPPRQRALFGLLLSRADHPVAIDTVIDDL
jgi:hypothetical protein